LFAMCCYQAAWPNCHYGTAVETAPVATGSVRPISEESSL
jgi:hypothetical protein